MLKRQHISVASLSTRSLRWHDPDQVQRVYSQPHRHPLHFSIALGHKFSVDIEECKAVFASRQRRDNERAITRLRRQRRTPKNLCLKAYSVSHNYGIGV